LIEAVENLSPATESPAVTFKRAKVKWQKKEFEEAKEAQEFKEAVRGSKKTKKKLTQRRKGAKIKRRTDYSQKITKVTKDSLENTFELS
jgi:hypothetical protein